jgi:hypothetical protein
MLRALQGCGSMTHRRYPKGKGAQHEQRDEQPRPEGEQRYRRSAAWHPRPQNGELETGELDKATGGLGLGIFGTNTPPRPPPVP